MNEGMENDSPKLEEFKPNLRLQSSSPAPFANQDELPQDKYADKEPHMSKRLSLQYGKNEADDALLRNSIAAYHTDLWKIDDEKPPKPPPDVNGKGSGSNEKSIPPTRPAEPGNFELKEPSPVQHPSPPHDPQPELEESALEALKVLNTENGTSKQQGLPEDKLVLPPPNFDNPEAKPPPSKQPRLERSLSPLSKYRITDPNRQDSLAPLCITSSAPSPEDSTRLPPIKELGSVPLPPNGLPARTGGPSYPLQSVAVSPPSSRMDPSPREFPRLAPLVQTQMPPTPYSHFSPASAQTMSAVSSPVSQQTYWRPKPSLPYPYDPPSAASNRSPASSYPTPIERPPGPCEPPFTPSSQGNGPGPTGTFKCTFPGCNALPFQTQYLLK